MPFFTGLLNKQNNRVNMQTMNILGSMSAIDLRSERKWQPRELVAADEYGKTTAHTLGMSIAHRTGDCHREKFKRQRYFVMTGPSNRRRVDSVRLAGTLFRGNARPF